MREGLDASLPARNCETRKCLAIHPLLATWLRTADSPTYKYFASSVIVQNVRNAEMRAEYSDVQVPIFESST